MGQMDVELGVWAPFKKENAHRQLIYSMAGCT